MIQIPVELGARRYTISIGHGALDLLPDLLGSLHGHSALVVASRRVWGLHGPRLARALAAFTRKPPILLPDGERHKCRATLALLHDRFLAAGLARDSLVLAFGGGVVGDLTGFAAATYMRGVAWVGLPTTLLSMVDSSIGGKVGINHPRAKNLIGAFHQPRAVVVDPTLLDTLPARQLQSGAYEALKCAILGDRALFRAFEQAPPALKGWDPIDLERAIAASCRIKAEIVEKDEREAGLRRVLNLGHTLGHAFEAVTAYRRFTHGEAVGWGLIGAAAIAVGRGILDPDTATAITTIVDHLGPRPPIADLPTASILAALTHDKKKKEGRVPFVLPTAIGSVEVQPDVADAEIRQALREIAVPRPR
jgi:3-dehydroquinate synthase